MKLTSARGFTLIELLVVIAIIGILSAVVLANLNSARQKGTDASVKSNLSNLRSQMELYYTGNNDSYRLGCSSTQVQKFLNAVSGSSCDSPQPGAWAADAPLIQQNQVNNTSGTDYWCVDSTGTSKLEDNARSGGVTVCS